MKFLCGRGLNGAFDVLRTQILMMRPFPDVSKVFFFFLVLQDERRIGSSNNDEGQVFINAIESRKQFCRDKGFGFFREGKVKICSFYERIGHLVDCAMRSMIIQAI